MSVLYWIALYLRLSKEDGDLQDESNSITNQRLLLEQYIQRNFENYELVEFLDDGYSGTNFRRPGITALLEQVRQGRINCVIVKDFSRFSRDYIELGSYLDQIFPFLGVRFISVNDNYDSASHLGNTTGLDTSFKGLLYDLYSKDLSVKVKSSLRIRKEQGQYISANAPFGYQKDPKDRHRLVIAEDEAEVVRKIFDLTLEGKKLAQIAKLFNQEKIPTPIEFKIKKKQTSRTPLGGSFRWQSTMINAILRNPVYAGDMVYNKTYKDEVGGKNHLRPKSEWKICKDHHDAIIPREIFEKMQEGWGQLRTRKPKMERHPLQGKVICGGCKRTMWLRDKILNPHFYCNGRYVYSDPEKCVNSMNLMFLEQVILYRIDSELSRQEEVEQLKRKKEAEIRREIKELEKSKERLIRKKAALQRERLEAYEKSVLESGYRFQTDDTAIEQVESQIEEARKKINRLESEIPRGREKFTDIFCREDRTVLTKEMVELLINKIVVYDEQQIEIEWKFQEENAAL